MYLGVKRGFSFRLVLFWEAEQIMLWKEFQDDVFSSYIHKHPQQTSVSILQVIHLSYVDVYSVQAYQSHAWARIEWCFQTHYFRIIKEWREEYEWKKGYQASVSPHLLQSDPEDKSSDGLHLYSTIFPFSRPTASK